MSADYGQTGIGGNVEFGKGGPRAKDSSGIVQFRNNADAAFAKVQAADPTVDDDLATKRYVDSVAGTPTWATVLGTGASTGANDPIINDGRSIIGVDVAGGTAGSWTLRAGNQTQATGSFIAGDLNLKGGDNASSGNAARGGNVVLSGGDNDVSTGATGGNLTCRAGRAGIGGEAIFAGGQGIAGNAAGAGTFQGGDNTATGRGGAGVFRGGDCTGAGAGSDIGGPATFRGGNARGSALAGPVLIQGGQPGGTSGSASGEININTNVLSGTNRQTGDINIGTGDSNALSSSSRSGSLNLTTGDATGTGQTGDWIASTGDSVDGDTGNMEFSTGNTASNDSSDPTGHMTFVTGNRTNTGSDANSGTGEISMTVGTSSNPNASGGGGGWSAKAGDNDGGGPAGDASVTAGFSNASGTPGRVALVAQSQGTTDDAHISFDTQSGSFDGSDPRMVNKGLAVSGGAGAVTAIALDGPTVDGQNIKVKVWATAKDDTAAGDQLSHQLEQTFFRNTTTQPMTANVDSSVVAGTWPAATLVTLTASGSQILVAANSLTTNASTWMFMVQWQVGGMAA